MLQRAPGMLQSGRAQGAQQAQEAASAAEGRGPTPRARLALAALQLASSVVFLGPFLFGGRPRGFPLDDAWIHQVVARTFAETGTLGYVPGAYGTGATSYLWAAILACGQKVGADPVVFTGLLGLVGALGTGQALLSLVTDGRGRSEPLLGDRFAPTWGGDGAAAVALACAGGDLTWFAFSGMEASFVTAAGLGALALATGPGLSARKGALAGALAGVAALTRPDFVPLGGIVAAIVLARRRSLREAALAVAPWALACLLYFGSNALFAGTPMPATMRGRRWLWIDSVQGNASTTSLAMDFFFAWAYRLRQFTLGLESNAALWAAVGLAAGGLVNAARERRLGLLACVGFAAFHAAVFAIVLPVPGHGGRYQPLVPVLFVLFAVLGTFDLARAIASRAPPELGLTRMLPFAGLAMWLACLGNAFWEWRLANRDAVTHIEKAEMAAGRAVAALPSDAVVASFDVGAIGWVSRRKLLDLGALTTPKVMDALEHDAVVDLLRREGVTHLVLPAGEQADFPDLSNFGFRLRLTSHPEIALTTLSEHFSDHDTWIRGVWYVQNATFRQRVSKVTFHDCTAPSAAPSPDAAKAGVAEVPGIPPAARARLDRAFAAAAARGLCVRVSEQTPFGFGPPLATGCFDVRLKKTSEPGSGGARPILTASLAGVPKGATLDPARVRHALEDKTQEYAKAGDSAGAAGAALHAVVEATREATPCFWTPLPALDAPLPPGFRPPAEPRETAFWGAVVAILVAMLVASGATVVAPGGSRRENAA